jgi:cytochrome c peroxidase
VTFLRSKNHRFAVLLAAQFALAPSSPAVAADDLRERANATLGRIAAATEAETAAPIAQLGRALFWDTRLSANGEIACASCHLAEDWGADRRRFSLDARGQRTKRHSQSVLNAQAAPAGLRWIGDRADGTAQAMGSITGSMGFDSADALVGALREHGYLERFEEAFPDTAEPLGAERYAAALQAYQRTLRTPAPFDAWLAGDASALTPRQRKGLERFMDAGCAGCHAGPLFGGGSLQRFGVVADYRPLTGSGNADHGLAEKTGKATDRDVFRVQPLRNVARTAPYFHDGAVADLAAAVDVMARVQLGQRLDDEAIADVVAFLGALSGPVPSHYGPPGAD